MACKYVKDFDFPSAAGFSASAGKQNVKGYMRGGSCYAEGGKVSKGQAKVGKVMSEFGKGALHSGSSKGPVVKNPKQAIAIALSEARKAGAKIPKKAEGGKVEAKRESMERVERKGMGAESEREVRTMQKAKTPVQPVPVPRPKPTPLERARALQDWQSRTGAPAGGGYRKGGKVMKKADGGVALMPVRPAVSLPAQARAVMPSLPMQARAALPVRALKKGGKAK
jgi:hypothetical protein